MNTTSNKLDLHGLSWSFGRAVYFFFFFKGSLRLWELMFYTPRKALNSDQGFSIKAIINGMDTCMALTRWVGLVINC